jgi:hypothetical protein
VGPWLLRIAEAAAHRSRGPFECPKGSRLGVSRGEGSTLCPNDSGPWRQCSAPSLRQFVRLEIEALFAECEQAAREDGKAERGGDPEEDQAEEVGEGHGRRVPRRLTKVRRGSPPTSVRPRPKARHCERCKVARGMRSR